MVQGVFVIDPKSGTMYNGTHSILLLNDSDFVAYQQTGKVNDAHKHTWYDWHLIPTSRPVIVMPKEKTKTVDLPGADGILDISEVLTGFLLYANRSGSLQFIVDNWHEDWLTLHARIMEYIHGKRLKMILTDEPDFYYEGRFTVDQWASEANNSKITLRYELGPYKKDVWGSMDDWLWDPFNFEKGVITLSKNLKVNGTLVRRVLAGQEHNIPNIIVSADMSLTFNGTTYVLKAGSNTPIRLSPGENILTFRGNGIVSIDYRRGFL